MCHTIWHASLETRDVFLCCSFQHWIRAFLTVLPPSLFIAARGSQHPTDSHAPQRKRTRSGRSPVQLVGVVHLRGVLGVEVPPPLAVCPVRPIPVAEAGLLSVDLRLPHLPVLLKPPHGDTGEEAHEVGWRPLGEPPRLDIELKRFHRKDGLDHAQPPQEGGDGLDFEVHDSGAFKENLRAARPPGHETDFVGVEQVQVLHLLLEQRAVLLIIIAVLGVERVRRVPPGQQPPDTGQGHGAVEGLEVEVVCRVLRHLTNMLVHRELAHGAHVHLGGVSTVLVVLHFPLRRSVLSVEPNKDHPQVLPTLVRLRA
eukprot:Hpha_TRINITY_DN16338_c2_g2::TRINITY_DN16338_c2_g2_i2::g.57719::m.57719